MNPFATPAEDAGPREGAQPGPHTRAEPSHTGAEPTTAAGTPAACLSTPGGQQPPALPGPRRQRAGSPLAAAAVAANLRRAAAEGEVAPKEPANTEAIGGWLAGPVLALTGLAHMVCLCLTLVSLAAPVGRAIHRSGRRGGRGTDGQDSEVRRLERKAHRGRRRGARGAGPATRVVCRSPLPSQDAGPPATSQERARAQQPQGGERGGQRGAGPVLAAAFVAANLGSAAAAGEVAIAGTASAEAIEIWLSGTVLAVTIPLRLLIAGVLLGCGILLLIYLGCRTCGSRGGGGAGMRRLRDAADAADAAKEAAGAVATGVDRMGNPPGPRAPPAQAPSAEQGFGRGGEVTRVIAPYPRPRR